MPDLAVHAEKMRLVQSDCEADAAALDRTPFTPRGIGEAFGSTLAMIAAVARGVEALAVEVQSLHRTLASRTEHLA